LGKNVFTSLIRQTAAGLRLLLVLTVITGVLYPLAVWGVSRVPGLQDKAEGSVLMVNGKPVGSALIGVDLVDEQAKSDPTRDRYFHLRPSALAPADGSPLAPGDPSSSLGSNKAADNEDYTAVLAERKKLIALREGVDESKIPADAITADFSGLDPQISPGYAKLQATRIARNTGIPLERVLELIDANTTGRALGILGAPGVNVLQLNIAIGNNH
jgi:K+-transporting ATPase ATPase C chain